MKKEQPTLSAEDIALWLQSHPQFFIEHPELISQMDLPIESAPTAGTTSLAAFQARRTQAELGKLKQQLQQLTEVAEQNEKLMHRLHDLMLSLMSKKTIDDFFTDLVSALLDEFSADLVCIHLEDLPKVLSGMAEVVSWDNQALDFLDATGAGIRAQCGRFTQAKLNALFPNRKTPIRSAAAIPIAHAGLLAIGSEDQARFQPQMGTLFLELLAATIAHRLNLTSPAEPEKHQ